MSDGGPVSDDGPVFAFRPGDAFDGRAPKGFSSYVANVGIKDASLDFMIVVSEVPCVATGVFTQSRFAGPAVTRSRQVLRDHRAQAVVTVSKNANVANGAVGAEHAERLGSAVAAALGIDPELVVQASTGVIGRPLPIELIEAHVAGLRNDPSTPSAVTAVVGLEPLAVAEVATAIMTTDTVPKYAGAPIGEASLVGVAKGVGMIEPDMATLLVFFFTDAELAADDLDAAFRRVIDRTFNCLSIDTDTSTSDTAVILANGRAGPVDLADFEAALLGVATELVLAVARDGEGATKLIEVIVDQASTVAQAKEVAKLIVNSPLVKTAVHGADPNWGRIVMAVGKAKDHTDIDPEKTVVRFGSYEVYPRPLDEAGLARVEELLASDAVSIHVSLGTGDESARVWGCDLSDGYVRINADYTT